MGTAHLLLFSASLTHRTSGGAAIDSFAYTYDGAGNVLTKEDPAYGYSYVYDPLNRLVSSTLAPSGGAAAPEAFTYDPAGNRQTGPNVNNTYTYDADNRLTQSTSVAYGYDDNGSMTAYTKTMPDGSQRVWTVTYDYESRPVTVVRWDGVTTSTAAFKYDPFGRRIEKRFDTTVNGLPVTKVFSYVYDNEDIILEIVETTVNNGAPTTETIRYVHGPGVDEPLLIQKNGIPYYYHADGLGSVTELTDSQQNVVESYRYTAYGLTTKTGDIVNNPYRFAGREFDPEIGIYYYRARYYDPGTGRFITKDPIGFAGGVNPYLYTENNPINKIDPIGLSSDYWDRYVQHLDAYLIDVGPYAAAMLGGLWPKSLSPATGGRPPALGSDNPLTSVPRALGIPGAGSAVIRSGAATIGVATVGIGFYNVGVFASGLVYAAFPGSNGLMVQPPNNCQK